jgi:hypothetical protein
MATGRTVSKFLRIYYDGYDISGYVRNIGPLATTFAEVGEVTALTDPLRGALPGQGNVKLGTYTGIFESTPTTGILALGNAGKGAYHDISCAIGIRAVPAAGDPVFCGAFLQRDFVGAIDKAGGITVTMPFDAWAANASSLLYSYPWGKLQHALGAETAVNAAVGMDWGAATAKGGYAVFHLMSSDNAVTLAVQHSTTTNVDGSFSNLITSGSLNASVTPAHSLVALSNTATVGQYTRWNISMGSATTATFVISFVRSYN